MLSRVAASCVKVLSVHLQEYPLNPRASLSITCKGMYMWLGYMQLSPGPTAAASVHQLQRHGVVLRVDWF